MLDPQYELLREIGRGGMGIVYLARDRRLKRLVAIKLLPPELAFRGEIRTRFLREAETAAQLSHPNIVPIYAVDERGGLVYFVMGFVDGDNLGTRLARREAIDAEQTRGILRDVADALAYAHSRGVIHRDIKPDNILICEDDGRVMVTDFGIARAVSEGDTRLTATGTAIGTPAYMSPEQSAGEREIDGRSDLYSLGVLGYQMLAGEPPFTANSTPALLVKHISEQPRPLAERAPQAPADLASIVMRLLEKDPDRRFADAPALVRALDGHEVQTLAPRPAVPTGPGALPPLATGGLPAPRPGAAPIEPAFGAPTAEELRRWEAPEVVRYRRRVAFYAAVNLVFLVIAIVGDNGLLGITTIWTILMAYWYAKLWTAGYDWRDVFRQPRDRLLMDVAAETMDDARAIFDREKRAEVRERARARRRLADGQAAGLDFTPPGARREPLPAVLQHDGPLADRVRSARGERDDVLRQWQQLPKPDRERVGDVPDTAQALAARIESLAAQVAELERIDDRTELAALDREIATLESQANPLEGAASESRVRRLAQLRRQRRAVADTAQRRDATREKLDSALLALQNLRFDLVRLQAGTQSHQQVTLLVERAQRLASDLDGIVAAEDALQGRVRRPAASAPDGA